MTLCVGITYFDGGNATKAHKVEIQAEEAAQVWRHRLQVSCPKESLMSTAGCSTWGQYTQGLKFNSEYSSITVFGKQSVRVGFLRIFNLGLI